MPAGTGFPLNQKPKCCHSAPPPTKYLYKNIDLYNLVFMLIKLYKNDILYKKIRGLHAGYFKRHPSWGQPSSHKNALCGLTNGQRQTPCFASSPQQVD